MPVLRRIVAAMGHAVGDRRVACPIIFFAAAGAQVLLQVEAAAPGVLAALDCSFLTSQHTRFFHGWVACAAWGLAWERTSRQKSAASILASSVLPIGAVSLRRRPALHDHLPAAALHRHAAVAQRHMAAAGRRWDMACSAASSLGIEKHSVRRFCQAAAAA